MITLPDNRKPVVFSDFDGTITERDVIVMIMEAFAPPEWKQIVHRILDERTLSIRDGVTQLFHLIPGSKKEEIIRYVNENVRFRQGFEAFLAFCRESDIPFLVVSGGVDFFIEPVLAPVRDQLEDVFCNTATFPDNRIELGFPYLRADCETCGQCACCKLGIMSRYPRDEYFHIAIGDSITDLSMARQADLVFARARLRNYCDEEGISYIPFETFDDVQQVLKDRLAVTHA